MGKFPACLFVPVLKREVSGTTPPTHTPYRSDRWKLPANSQLFFTAHTAVTGAPEDGHEGSGGEGCAMPSGMPPPPPRPPLWL